MSRAKNRIVALLLGLSLALTAAACSDDDSPPTNDVGSWTPGLTLLAR